MSTTYESVIERRAKDVASMRESLRAALATALPAEDVETVAKAAESELGEFKFREIAEELAGKRDDNRLLRACYFDVLDAMRRRSESGCLFGFWYRVECALKERLFPA